MAMNNGDGRKVSLWDMAAVLAWITATCLMVADLFVNKAFGHLGAFGGLCAAVAMTITIRCIAQRHLDETCKQMRMAYEYGRESVARLR